MKVMIPFLAVAAMQLLQQTTGKTVEFNRALAKSYADKHEGVKFVTMETSPLPANVLLAKNYMADTVDCTVRSSTQHNGQVTIVLAISECVPDATLNVIKDWIQKLALASLDDGTNKFVLKPLIVPGSCQRLSEENQVGRETGFDDTWHEENLLAKDAKTHGGWEKDIAPLANESLLSEAKRAELSAKLERFAQFTDGTDTSIVTLTEFEELATSTPVAVISFLDTAHSFAEVTKFERTLKIDTTYNFHVCAEGHDCTGHFENCIELPTDIDLFMYNPFTVTRSFQCDKLEGGIPTSYVNANGDRECYCSCPAGTEFAVNGKPHKGKGKHKHLKHGSNQGSHSGSGVRDRELLLAKDEIASHSGSGSVSAILPPPPPPPSGPGSHEGPYESSDSANPNHYSCKTVVPDKCQCVWNQHPFGYKHTVTTKLDKCELSSITQWGVPVPFPIDNYVADERVNNHDTSDLALGPHVTVTSTRIRDPVYDIDFLLAAAQTGGHRPQFASDAASNNLPTKWADVLTDYMGSSSPSINQVGNAVAYTDLVPELYTWRDYQENSQTHIDELVYHAYGKYHLDVDANDYQSDAMCDGCVAIVDKFRPKRTTPCPKGFCDNTDSDCSSVHQAELTVENMNHVNELIAKFYDYHNKAVNDACSGSDFGGNRCDEKVLKVRDFFSSSYDTAEYTTAQSVFTAATVLEVFAGHAEANDNPLANDYGVLQEPTPVEDGKCTRCVDMKTSLREHWTNYMCGHNYDIQYCSGDPTETCSFNQCLTLHGYSLATAVARIKPSVTQHSQAVLEEVTDKSFETYTQVHVALQCSKFGGDDGKCDYEASVNELIETQTRWNLEAHHGESSDEHVFWRYKYDTGNWNLMNGGHGHSAGDLDNGGVKHTFNKDQTKITVEAWTQCGRVRVFYFYVILHLNSKILVCDHFDNMWYQTSVNHLAIAEKQLLCAYPGSDFAELTFDFRPFAGLEQTTSTTDMHISKVTCQGKFENRAPAEILHVVRDSPEIVERFAIEMLNQATTQPTTKFNVQCDFTYTRFDKSELVHTCKRAFEIKDCSPPTIDYPPHGECLDEACAGDDAPGPYEACGGTVVSATATATYVEDEDQVCCDKCDEVELVCTPVLGLPTGDIKRCEPANGEDQYTGAYAEFLASTGLSHAQGTGVATALLAASALVAMVALVVVKRRTPAAKVDETEDAYYPLLQ